MPWNEVTRLKLKVTPGALICRECFEPVPNTDRARYEQSGGLCTLCEASIDRIWQDIRRQEFRMKQDRQE